MKFLVLSLLLLIGCDPAPNGITEGINGLVIIRKYQRSRYQQSDGSFQYIVYGDTVEALSRGSLKGPRYFTINCNSEFRLGDTLTFISKNHYRFLERMYEERWVYQDSLYDMAIELQALKKRRK